MAGGWGLVEDIPPVSTSFYGVQYALWNDHMILRLFCYDRIHFNSCEWKTVSPTIMEFVGVAKLKKKMVDN